MERFQSLLKEPSHPRLAISLRNPKPFAMLTSAIVQAEVSTDSLK
jgi:hypothetical protein